jgi:hypothetical protein
MSPKVGCSDPSMTVDGVWVGHWLKGCWFWSEAWRKPSSGWSLWLNSHGGIVRVVFGLKTWWVPNVST